MKKNVRSILEGYKKKVRLISDEALYTKLQAETREALAKEKIVGEEAEKLLNQADDEASEEEDEVPNEVENKTVEPPPKKTKSGSKPVSGETASARFVKLFALLQCEDSEKAAQARASLEKELGGPFLELLAKADAAEEAKIALDSANRQVELVLRKFEDLKVKNKEIQAKFNELSPKYQTAVSQRDAMGKDLAFYRKKVYDLEEAQKSKPSVDPVVVEPTRVQSTTPASDPDAIDAEFVVVPNGDNNESKKEEPLDELVRRTKEWFGFSSKRS